MYDVIVVGGGIAGLFNSILLSRKGLHVALFEKKVYPFHRVCGEYISNEVKPFLLRNDLFPEDLNPANISQFQLTSVNGHLAELPLGLGGFGISRYAFDDYLYHQAKNSGVAFFENTTVTNIDFENESFEVIANKKSYQSRLVIGAQGKRSILDKDRKFMQKKSPYLGVKYHIKSDQAPDQIALHNFRNGYCGISQVENQTFNLCYLSHRDNLKKHKTVEEMEYQVLHENPFLKNIWATSDFLFDKPEVINEISFEKKELVYNHILMCGDTAGMITPLCGNGMAMAIRSARILSELIIKYCNKGQLKRIHLEQSYEKEWSKQFSARLWTGRQIQKMFGSSWSSNLAVHILKNQKL
ncbi:NAD(P)/FAD-dependent oxidoreductase, partial [Reichenbachiella sp.]